MYNHSLYRWRSCDRDVHWSSRSSVARPAIPSSACGVRQSRPSLWCRRIHRCFRQRYGNYPSTGERRVVCKVSCRGNESHPYYSLILLMRSLRWQVRSLPPERMRTLFPALSKVMASRQPVRGEVVPGIPTGRLQASQMTHTSNPDSSKKQSGAKYCS